MDAIHSGVLWAYSMNRLAWIRFGLGFGFPCLLTLWMLLPGSATLPLLDRDEPRFATATLEMISRGQWVVPTFNGQERFDKPILTYWLMRMGYAIAGQTELGARLHSILATLGLVWVTYRAGARWFGPGVGWYAAVGLVTCLQVIVHGRLAVADMLLVLAIAVAQVSIGDLLLRSQPSSRRRSLSWWGLYVALGVGFLAKGPVAWAVSGLSVILFRWVFKQRVRDWGVFDLGRGLIVVLSIVCAWGIPALWITEGRFLRVGLGEHVVLRGVEGFNGRGFNPLFYLATSVFSLFPWIVLVPGLVWLMKNQWGGRNAWLASWFAAPYLIFTPYATQLPHYVLPGFPAFFMLLAQVLERGPATLSVLARRWAIGMLTIFLCLLGAIGWAACRAPLSSEVEPLGDAVVSLVLVVSGVGLIPLGWLLGTRAGFAGLLLLAVGCHGAAVHLRAMSTTTQLSRIWHHMDPKTRFIGCRYMEPSVVFYSRGQWDFLDDFEPLPHALDVQGDVLSVSVIEERDPLEMLFGGLSRIVGVRMNPRVRSYREDWEKLGMSSWAQGRPGWRIRDVRGLNVGRGRWQTLRVLWRETDVRPGVDQRARVVAP